MSCLGSIGREKIYVNALGDTVAAVRQKPNSTVNKTKKTVLERLCGCSLRKGSVNTRKVAVMSNQDLSSIRSVDRSTSEHIVSQDNLTISKGSYINSAVSYGFIVVNRSSYGNLHAEGAVVLKEANNESFLNCSKFNVDSKIKLDGIYSNFLEEAEGRERLRKASYSFIRAEGPLKATECGNIGNVSSFSNVNLQDSSAGIIKTTGSIYASRGRALILEAEGSIELLSTEVKRVVGNGESVEIRAGFYFEELNGSVISDLQFTENAVVYRSRVGEISLTKKDHGKEVRLELEDAEVSGDVILSCEEQPCSVALRYGSTIQGSVNLFSAKHSEVTLKEGSIIKGDVIFAGEPGTVLLGKGASIKGSVINGSVIEDAGRRS